MKPDRRFLVQRLCREIHVRSLIVLVPNVDGRAVWERAMLGYSHLQVSGKRKESGIFQNGSKSYRWHMQFQ